MSEKKRRDYAVGYGKPPQPSQFKKGRSGNPKGRPKGASNTKKKIKRMLEAPNPVRVGEQARIMTTIDLALERVREGVRKDDKRAVAQALSLARELDKDEEAKAATAPASAAATEPLSEEDQAILLDYLRREEELRNAF